MNRVRLPLAALLVAAALTIAGIVTAGAQRPLPSAPAFALGNAIAYQGQLKQNGSPVNNVCDMAFRVYNDLSAGDAVGIPITTAVIITSGIFTSYLDFGSVFTGEARWLDIQVRCPGGAGSYVALAPRQPILAAPYALFAAAPWVSSAGSVYYLGNAGIGTANPLARLHVSDSSAAPNAALRAENSGGGHGVLGSSSANTGAGVVGTAPLTGVLGVATNNTGITYGIAGRTDGPNGYGVYGTTTGESASGVYGINTYANITATGRLAWNGAGVYGNGVRGVLGIYSNLAVQSSGSLGNFDSGVSGQFVPAGGAGVMGTTANGVAVQAVGAYSGTGDLFVGCATSFAACTGNTDNVVRIDQTGKGFFDGGTQNGGADVAEFITASGDPQAGDVVEIDPEHDGQFRIAATANSAAVAGVISSAPGVSLNARSGATAARSGPQLALAGRVPVKASAENGAIRPGDLLVAAVTAGHAMRAPAQPAPGTIIGKALGTLAEGKGVIEMLVMLR